jgi:hypothetical protein
LWQWFDPTDVVTPREAGEGFYYVLCLKVYFAFTCNPTEDGSDRPRDMTPPKEPSGERTPMEGSTGVATPPPRIIPEPIHPEILKVVEDLGRSIVPPLPDIER